MGLTLLSCGKAVAALGGLGGAVSLVFIFVSPTLHDNTKDDVRAVFWSTIATVVLFIISCIGCCIICCGTGNAKTVVVQDGGGGGGNRTDMVAV